MAKVMAAASRRISRFRMPRPSPFWGSYSITNQARERADRVGGHLARVAEHDIGELAHLGRGGHLHVQRHRERRDLRRPRVAGHDLVHRPGGLTAAQILAVRQPAQDLAPRGRGPARSAGSGRRLR